MIQPSRTISSAVVRGFAGGVIFMALFGTLWAYIGIMGLQGLGTPLLLVTANAIGIVMFIGGASLMLAARKLKTPTSISKSNGKRIAIWFGWRRSDPVGNWRSSVDDGENVTSYHLGDK
ncbi:hypothetical protein RE628_13660 [Paenibacillus sp. D2_2]|uniref:hypothetical protein n=1 Tax=Paenibacillus sp. D2_2 TaxID=3073092 RepID=UPI002815D42D|nr:hypothetical protein [Paenibacillus sp. D2_2]WMT43206.1 hypothetical protein RE628_13660 [Paenibacillus sp. D2_2]